MEKALSRGLLWILSQKILRYSYDETCVCVQDLVEVGGGTLDLGQLVAALAEDDGGGVGAAPLHAAEHQPRHCEIHWNINCSQ